MKPTVWCQEGDANGRGIGGMLFLADLGLAEKFKFE